MPHASALANNTKLTSNQILKKYFGYDEFREGQKEIVESIISGQDTLAIRSTGSGKSICFQVPALYYPGTTLVISPLISLMADQVDALNKLNIPTTFINSSLSRNESQQRIKNLVSHQYKLVYLSPEKLGSKSFAKILPQLKVNFIAIDEAHCISMWGHDFRPSYQRIPLFISRLPTKPVLGVFTATATDRIAADIKQWLNLSNPVVFKQSALRTNLNLNVIHCQSRAEKQLALIKLLKNYQEKTGIVYCTTRRSTQIIADMINYLNIRQQLTDSRAEAYHGGLDSEKRAEIQERFMKNQSKIICATNAFGMGVDKSDIRYVIHYQLPANLENYYQEVGRAGRDGDKSECFLLYCDEDVYIQQWLLSNKTNKRLKIEQKKLKIITEAMTQGGCLQQVLAKYFSDPLDQPCGKCGFCRQYQIDLSESEQENLRQIQSHELLGALPFQTQYFIALLSPETMDEWSSIPGIGQGMLEQMQACGVV
jgi:ATP-dependent DNA helicase RecQ